MRKMLFLIVLSISFFFAGCSNSPSVREPEVSLAREPVQEFSDDFSVLDPEFTVYDLSKLRVGMTKSEVRNLFSNPRTIKKAPKDEYWEYIWFELYFREGLLANWFELDL